MCSMFLIPKCRGDWDLGQCTFWVLAKREPLCNDDFRKKMCFARKFFWNLALCSVSLFASTKKVHRPGSLSPLHFDIENMEQIHLGTEFSSARRLLSAARLERWPQVCHIKIIFIELTTNRFIFTKKFVEMRCKLNFTEIPRLCEKCPNPL